jgi:hypothetical protein
MERLMPTATKPDRSILIQRSSGQQQIVRGIPATAKLTYGPVNPGKQGYGANCLRIYTVGNNQLAVFTDVAWFRDLSLTVQTRKKSEKQERQAERGPAGAKVKTATEESYEWVDGDVEDATPAYPSPF